jgi:uncharacterized protein YfdQ (DUF2303 family)
MSMTPSETKTMIENHAKTLPSACAVESIATLARQTVLRHANINGTEVPSVIWPDKSITTLEHLCARPTRKRAQAHFQDVPSFVRYVDDHRTEGTVITGTFDQLGGSFRALIDYSAPWSPEAGEPEAQIPGAPSWCEHTAVLNLTATPEWAKWLSKNTVKFDQVEFAEFLEDNAADITVPETDDGATWPTQLDLMSTALTLQVKTGVNFSNAVRLQNGQTQLTYQESVQGHHGTDGTMVVPDKFALALAPFVASPKYLVKARLRYRAAGGKASFTYQVERPHLIIKNAFEDILKQIAAGLDCQVLLGSITPETRAR